MYLIASQRCSKGCRGSIPLPIAQKWCSDPNGKGLVLRISAQAFAGSIPVCTAKMTLKELIMAIYSVLGVFTLVAMSMLIFLLAGIIAGV